MPAPNSISDVRGRKTALVASIVLAALVRSAGGDGPAAEAHSFRGHRSEGESGALAFNSHLTDVCSPDAAFFAVANALGKVAYCRLEDGVVLRTFYLCAPKILAFSMDGELLAGAGYSCQQPIISVWRLSDGQTVLRVENPSNKLERLEFTRDGKSLVGWDEKAGKTVWILSSGLN